MQENKALEKLTSIISHYYLLRYVRITEHYISRRKES